MDASVVTAIVALATAVAGGPHVWRWLVERRRAAADIARVERADVDEAEHRHFMRLEARVDHLEARGVSLERALDQERAEKRVLEHTLDQERTEKRALRHAYEELSESMAAEQDRACTRETELAQQIAAQNKRIQALESALRERDRVVAEEITRAIASELAKRDAR